MENSEDMQAASMQVATQASMVAVRAVGEANPPTELHTRNSNLEEPHRLRKAGPILSQPAFDCKTPDR